MAILPTKVDLGTVIPSGQRPIAVADASGIGRGIVQLGQGAQQLGSDLSFVAKKQRRDAMLVDSSTADAGYLKDREALRLQVTSDGDYATQQKRFDEGNNLLMQKWGGAIGDPRARQIWMLDSQKNSVEPSSSVQRHAITGTNQARAVQLEDNLKTYQSIIADPRTSEEARQRAQANAQATIDAARNEGVITPEGAQQWGDTYVKGGRVQLRGTEVETKDGNKAVMPPVASGSREQHGMQVLQGEGLSNVAAAGMLGNFIAESGNKLDPSAVNPHDGKDGSDSIGIGQWNSGRATALKAFAASRGKPWNDLDTQLAFAAHEIKTSYPQAWAKLQAARTGDEAAAIIVTQYTKPAGSQSGATASHQWARRRDEALRLAGGKFSPGSGETSPDPYLYTYGKIRDQNPDFSPQQVEALTQRAISANNRFKVEDRANLQQIEQDAPAAIQSTGSYTGSMPTRTDFLNAYGGDEGGRKYDAFKASVDTSHAVYGFLTATPDQIRQQVDAAKPTATGEGAALEAARYKALAEGASATLTARQKDPVAYVQQAFSNVAAAWQQAAQPGGDYAAAIRATVAAQTQIGVPAEQQQPVLDTVAAAVVKTAKDETAKPEDRLSAIAHLVFATPDKGQRQAIIQQLERAGMPGTMGGVIEAYGRGDVGAAQRLFAAATIKPGDLPGKMPKTDAEIGAQIQTDIMDAGKIGDAVYGLSAGLVENGQRAQDDATLLKNATKLELLHNGGDLGAAVARAAKDRFGDVTVLNEGQISAAIPVKTDSGMFIDGLNLKKADALANLEHFGEAMPKGTPAEQQQARMSDMDKRAYIETLRRDGVWRNLGDGYGFFDKSTGLFIAGPDGKPFVVTEDQALNAAKDALSEPRPAGGVVETPRGPAVSGQPSAPLTRQQYDLARERQQREKTLRRLKDNPAAVGTTPDLGDLLPP